MTMWSCTSFFCSCFVLSLCFLQSSGLQHVLDTGAGKDPFHLENDRKPAKIAIIGSGITGAVAAFNVYEGFRNRRTSLDDPLPEITVFERNPIIGGRITQAYAYGDPRRPVDTCAQYFAATDTCISQSIQSVGLRSAIFNVPPDVGTGAWNGTQFLGFIEERGFRDPSSWSAFKTAKWYSRYGNIPQDFDGNATQISRQFDAILRPTLTMPSAPGSPNMPNQPRSQRNLSAVVDPIRQAVTSGIAGSCDPQRDDKDTCQRYADFVTDVLDPAVNERFFTGAFEAQVPPARLNALAVYRSYQALRQNVVVAGGNLRLIERLLTLANATVRVSTEIVEIQHSGPEGPSLIYRDHLPGSDAKTNFDMVILAAPFRPANLTISPALNRTLMDTLLNNPTTYLDTFVTHFTSPALLNGTVFDPHLSPSSGSPQRILSSAPFTNDPPFISLRLVQSLSNSQPPGRPGRPVKTDYLYRLVTRSAPDLDILPTWLNDPIGKGPEITWMHVQSLPLSTPAGYGAAPLLENVEIASSVLYAGGGEQVLGIAEFGCKMGANAAELVLEKLLTETGRADTRGE